MTIYVCLKRFTQIFAFTSLISYLCCNFASAQTIESVIQRYVEQIGGTVRLDSLFSVYKKYTSYSAFGKIDTVTHESIEKRALGAYRQMFDTKNRLLNEYYSNRSNAHFVFYRPVFQIQNAQQFIPEIIHPAQEILRLLKNKKFKSIRLDTMLKSEVLSLQAKDQGIEKTFLFDPNSGLLIATRLSTLPNNLETLSDYRTVGGLLFPFYTDSRQFGRILSKQIFEKIIINQPVDNNAFVFKEPKKLPQRDEQSRYNQINWVENQNAIGSVADLTKHFSGQTLLVDLWATWCGPCKFEFSKYNDAFYKMLDSLRIKILFLSIDKKQDETKWRKDVDWYNINGYHLLATNSLIEDIQKLFYKDEPMFVPRYFLISKDGIFLSTMLPKPSNNSFMPELKRLIARK